MSSIQKVKKKNGEVIFRCQLFINGVRDSKNFSSREDAKIWGAQREAEIRSQSIPLIPTPPPPTTKTLRDVFERYKREVSPTKVGKRWEEIRLNALGRYPIADIALDDLGPEHIAQWRDDRLKQVSSSTVRRELVLFNHALHIAKTEWRWLKGSNPCRDVRKPSDAPHRKQRISDDDLHKLITALGYVEGTTPTNHNHQVAIALLLCIETACRSGEVLGLKKEHIHLKEQYIHLPTTKNGHSRDVPLSPRAVHLLSLMISTKLRSGGNVFTVSSAVKDTLFRRAKIKAGLEHIHFHDSRREATSRLSEIFGPMELSRITGHRDLKMLMRYYEKPVSELAMKLMEKKS